MDPADVIQVLDRLDGAGVTAWLDGGWGVDALIGEQTRAHEDLDLAIARHDCPLAQETLAGLGFRPAPEVEPGFPARRVLRAADGRRVDLHPLVFQRQTTGTDETEHSAGPRSAPTALPRSSRSSLQACAPAAPPDRAPRLAGALVSVGLPLEQLGDLAGVPGCDERFA
jgi:hypothetical protein